VVITDDMLSTHSVPIAYVEDRAIKAGERSKVLGIQAATALSAQQTLMWTDRAIDRRSGQERPSMRPDRIVVGECRGGEALDMLQAMKTGHDGSLTTTHANSPTEALGRRETLCLMAGVDLPSRAIHEQIASSVHLIVQQSRLADGRRKVTAISELGPLNRHGEFELRHKERHRTKR
jgi:hypothetical protein